MQNIYDLHKEELIDNLKNLKIPKFRASQIWNFIYKNNIQSFSQMHNLPKTLIEVLENEFKLEPLKEKINQRSKDKTQKSLLILEDGEEIETVLMKYKHGNSVCVTTQIGCKIGCSFCASHLGGFKRNLSAGEIVQQVMYWENKLQQYSEHVDNIVVMGIGEPFDNLDNVFKFIDIINDDDGLNIGARKITISTSGIMSQMDRFIDYPKQVNLAISMHASNDSVRSKIMKINNVYNIASIMEGVEKYLEVKNRQITFEYILLKGINDERRHAKELANLIGELNIHVNLIPYNKVDEYEYDKTQKNDIDEFYNELIRSGVSATIRQQKGNDIDGACGQLRRKGQN